MSLVTLNTGQQVSEADYKNYWGKLQSLFEKELPVFHWFCRQAREGNRISFDPQDSMDDSFKKALTEHELITQDGEDTYIIPEAVLEITLASVHGEQEISMFTLPNDPKQGADFNAEALLPPLPEGLSKLFADSGQSDHPFVKLGALLDGLDGGNALPSPEALLKPKTDNEDEFNQVEEATRHLDMMPAYRQILIKNLLLCKNQAPEAFRYLRTAVNKGKVHKNSENSQHIDTLLGYQLLTSGGFFSDDFIKTVEQNSGKVSSNTQGAYLPQKDIFDIIPHIPE